MNFASDNTAGVCPEVLAAIATEAGRTDAAYGDDATSARLEEALSEVFEREVAVFPVATGTAANSLALAATNPPWGGVLCHRDAHIAVDELAAPTVIGGGISIVGIDGEHGKVTPAAVDDAFARVDHGVHTVPFTALSLTQTTEAGTRYTHEELAALGRTADRHGLVVHLDGARFANAVAATAARPADLTWRAGVQLLSLGATKGGALAAEAVVVFDPDVVDDVGRHRKRTGHLLSKQRLVAAQFLGWLADDTWLRRADHANAMAARLAHGVVEAGLEPLHPVEANMVFVELDERTERTWLEAGTRFYAMPHGEGRRSARLVTSWSTGVDEVDRFVEMAGRVGPPD